MSSTRPRRKQKIVDAKFQLGLGLHLVGWIYLYIVIFAMVANFQALSSLMFADIADPEYVQAVQTLRGFARFVVVPLALTFVFMAFHAVLVTHRIAGPIYRAKMVLRDMARRKFPTSVRFRDKDYLADLAEEMTTTVQALREDQARLRRMNAETSDATRRLLVALEAGMPRGELEVLTHGALDAAERLDRHLAGPDDDLAPGCLGGTVEPEPAESVSVADASAPE